MTIVSYGPPLYTIEKALGLLKEPGRGGDELERLVPKELRGLSVELIDLRTIVPYDVSGNRMSGIRHQNPRLTLGVAQIETVVASVNKTGRCIIVHEAPLSGGMGSELAAEIQQRCFLRLEAPVQRVTGWDTPFGLAYEKFYVPDPIRVVRPIAARHSAILQRPSSDRSPPFSRAARLAHRGDALLDLSQRACHMVVARQNTRSHAGDERPRTKHN